MSILDKIQEKALKLISGRGINRIQDPISDIVLGSAAAGGAHPRTGTEFLLRSYSTMPWLRAVTGKIGKSIGATTWKLFIVRNGEQERAVRMKDIQRAPYESRHRLIRKVFEKGELEEIDDHPFLDLLHEGNPRISGSSLFELTSIYRDTVGEAFWILEKNILNTPVAVWPIPSHWVTAMPRIDFPFYRIRMGAHDFDVPVTEVISFIENDPADPYGRGSGIAKTLGDELETDEFAAKHTSSFFRNNARPDLIISADGLSRADTARLEQDWNEKHQGFWSSFKAHFINRKIDVQTLSQNFNEMQLKDLREMERNIIMQVYSIPPEKLGVLTQSNRATIESADAFYTKDILMPRLEDIRRTLQNQLVPFFDSRLIVDYESPIIEDKEHQLKVMVAMPGAFTINEWRAEASLESIGEDGEIFLVRPGEGTRNPEDAVDPPGGTDQGNPDEDDDKDDSKAIQNLIKAKMPEIARIASEKIKERII